MERVAGVVEKIDGYGMVAWLGLVTIGFIVAWPVGLAILAYLLWSGRMKFWKHNVSRMQKAWSVGSRTSGNSAFDEYRADTLQRLENEEREFRAFMERLRSAKDKEEFDQFMAERRA